MKRNIVILALSEKNANYCVAGIDIKTGEWMRPYSDIEDINGAVPLDYAICDNGHEIKIGDVVEIDLNEYCNNRVQPENFYYDQSKKWKYIDHWNMEQIWNLHKCDERDKIFFSLERRLTQEELDNVKQKESLLLLYITNVEVVVKMNKGQKKFAIDFTYNKTKYQGFSLGDRNIRKTYNNRKEGNYKFCQKAFVVFSLTDKFLDGRYYKMAAQFIIWR